MLEGRCQDIAFSLDRNFSLSLRSSEKLARNAGTAPWKSVQVAHGVAGRENGWTMSTLTTALAAPPEVAGTLSLLLPRLGAHGVDRLEVFQYGRPGEPRYWLAFLFADGRRYSLGTPELRGSPLEDQFADLMTQIADFTPRGLSLADELFGMSDAGGRR